MSRRRSTEQERARCHELGCRPSVWHASCPLHGGHHPYSTPSGDARFELPECRDEALRIATDEIESGSDNVCYEALQWLDSALNDALTELEGLRAFYAKTAKVECSGCCGMFQPVLQDDELGQRRRIGSWACGDCKDKGKGGDVCSICGGRLNEIGVLRESDGRGGVQHIGAWCK